LISASSELLPAVELFIFVNLADKSALLLIAIPACVSALFALMKVGRLSANLGKLLIFQLKA
jgi:hypothetical protein